ncbi:NAD(P)H nitroreductase [Thalassotalea piscium]
MLDSLSLLVTRQSTPQLCQPAPKAKEIETILAAGMRAPDHGGLTPWHFTVIQDDGLTVLSNIFLDAVAENELSQTKRDKIANMPFRAPLIIVVSTQYQQHDKVPEKEQLMAAGCACHAMQMACVALGYGAMWRTGDLTYNNKVKSALSIEPHNDIVGFLYIGSKASSQSLKPAKPFEQNVSYL